MQRRSTGPPSPGAPPEPEHLYQHLGISWSPVSETASEGDMVLRPDMRTPGGPMAAILALLLEGTGGGVVLQTGLPVLVDLDFHVCDEGAGLGAVRARSDLVRRGAQRVVMAGSVYDAERPERVLAYGTIGYWMLRAWSAEEQAARDAAAMVRPLSAPRASLGDPLPVPEFFGMHLRPDEPVCELGSPVHAAIAAVEGRLHGGAHQLMHEAAALGAARHALRSDRVVTTDLIIRFLSGATAGPFVATATLLATSGDDALCRVELNDAGAGGGVRSLSTIRLRRNEPS